jgi:hypothetical protein
MPLTIPSLDDRTYQQIFDELRARIPVHTPEWTNFNDSDPGITLMQLFSYLAKGVLQRANFIPERNRLAFLSLLGMSLRSPASAIGVVSFKNERAPIDVPIVAPPGMELLSGAIPFRTVQGLEILPVDGVCYYKRLAGNNDELKTTYQDLYASFTDNNKKDLVFYDTVKMNVPGAGVRPAAIDFVADSLDNSLWLALLARSADLVVQTRNSLVGKVLTVSLIADLNAPSDGVASGAATGPSPLSQIIYQVPETAATSPAYETLTALPYASSNPFVSTVQVQLPSRELNFWTNFDPLDSGTGDFPPSLEDTAIAARLVSWIRIRLSEEALHQGASCKVCLVATNSIAVQQRVRVASEAIGKGTSEPDQAFKLTHTPVIAETCTITVSGVVWSRIDDIGAAPPEAPSGTIDASSYLGTPLSYSLDPQAGIIRFGNGKNGARPPDGSIIAAHYDYGGGSLGMVGIATITKAPLLPAGVTVSNPLPTWGGDDGETEGQAERRISRYLQHRDRLVTDFDFKDIAWRCPGVSIGRIEVLPLFLPSMPDIQAAGVVTILVIPKSDSLQPDAPIPDSLFLSTMCDYLDQRRVLTTELYVCGPSYVKLWITVGIDTVPGADIAVVRENVKSAIRYFLSPFTGGFNRKGWPLGTAVELLEIMAVAARVENISKINGIKMVLSDASTIVDQRVSITGLQLPRLMKIDVGAGEPSDPFLLRDTSPVSTTETSVSIPAPQQPQQCILMQ